MKKMLKFILIHLPLNLIWVLLSLTVIIPALYCLITWSDDWFILPDKIDEI